ncbi:MAG: ATP-binding protein [Lysobacterales bacterium]
MSPFSLDQASRIDTVALAFWSGARTVLLGPPGAGKPIWPSVWPSPRPNVGRRVLMHLGRSDRSSLQQAKTAGRLNQRLAVLTHPSLLVVDEIGYFPVSHDGAVLFFQLMNRRYERASTVLTWYKPFNTAVSSATRSWPLP